jgi:hypothetical protein
MNTVLISKHVVCGFHSSSSNDVWLKVLTNTEDVDFELKKGVRIKSEKFPALNGETIEDVSGDELFTSVYVTIDEKFSNKALLERNFLNGYSDTSEFKEHVGIYAQKGWRIENETIPEQKAFWEREEQRTAEKMKAEGYVLWQRYEDLKKEPITVYQGGFSDELFNNSYLQEYISRGGVFGWIGNFSRKAYLDEAIEAGLKKRNLSEEKIATWLTSSDGRHFADGLEGFEKEEQLQKVEENLNRIFNIALIYSSTFHKGTYDSTCEIRKDYEAQGILLPEDGSTYDAEGHFKLLEAFFKAMNIKKKGEE